MKVSIDSIKSAGIRSEMARDSYTTAELLGTYSHPQHEGNDWTIRLYRAADSLVFETNGDPVWEGMNGFDALAAEYGVDLTAT
jgi:hypothetical protein